MKNKPSIIINNSTHGKKNPTTRYIKHLWSIAVLHISHSYSRIRIHIREIRTIAHVNTCPSHSIHFWPHYLLACVLCSCFVFLHLSIHHIWIKSVVVCFLSFILSFCSIFFFSNSICPVSYALAHRSIAFVMFRKCW